MQRFLAAVLAVLASTATLYAQSPGQLTQGPGNTAGLLYASNFGQWKIQGNSAFSWSGPTGCAVTADGMTLNPVFKVGTPVQIIDANPALNEVVTPTAVNVSGSGCSISVTPVHQHYSFYITSATAGLQESINWAAGLPYSIIVTPDWSRMGGVTSTITSAQGNTNAWILDERVTGLACYSWSGIAYVNSNCASGGSGNVTSVGLSMPSIFTVTGSPVTSSGTLAAALNTQNANTVFAGPASGSPAVPTFRALQLSDIPGAIGATGTIVPGDCTSWASATTVEDAGAPCGTGSGGVSFTVSGQALPWDPTLPGNSSYPFAEGPSGNHNGTAPVVVATGLIAGATITVSATGTVYSASNPYPAPGLAYSNGPAAYPTSASYGTFPFSYAPSATSSGPPQLMGLMGAFTDSAGNLVKAVGIGDGATVTTPAGATRFQLGINDILYSDNSGQFIVSVSVSGQGSSVATPIKVNGNFVAIPANFNGTTPAAGSNGYLCTWQYDSSGNISCEIVGDGNSAHYLDGTGHFSTPAGSGGISGLTTGYIPMATSASSIGNSHLDDGATTASTVTSSEPIAAPAYKAGSGSTPTNCNGVGAGCIALAEGSALTPSAGVDTLRADATNHCIEMSLNGGAEACIGSGGGSGTVTDGTGTTTAGQIATSTTTSHQIQYSTALPNGTTATTQAVGDNSTKVATTAFVLANAGGGATFTVAPPYLVSGGVNYLPADNMFAATLPPASPTWINSAAPSTVTTGAHGDLLLGATGTSVDHYLSVAGSSSAEAVFAFTGTSSQTLGVGIYDSTNGIIWTLDILPSGGNIQIDKQTYTGSGTPSYVSGTRVASGPPWWGPVHFKVSAQSGSISFQASFDGGGSYRTLGTVCASGCTVTNAVGTIVDGIFHFFEGTAAGQVDILSLGVQ